MANRALIAILFLFVLIATPVVTQAQSYRFSPYPDLWFNDVDGIRLGLRVLGEVEGTFKDGPHRLDAGVWVGSKLPKNPVSYYFSFTEPIAAISDFGKEGSVQFESFIRTGISKHGLYLNKRWQSDFNDSRYLNLQIGGYGQKHFDESYRQFGEYWLMHPTVFRRSDNFENLVQLQDWMYFLTLKTQFSSANALGIFFGEFEYLNQFEGVDTYFKIDLELQQIFNLSNNIKLRVRSFTGIAEEDTPYQYSYLKGSASMIDWLDNSFVRAEGSLPINAFDNALFQIMGGSNIRGYVNNDFKKLLNGSDGIPTASGYDNFLLTMISGLNFDLEYPNPLNNLIDKSSLINDVVEFRSYVFFDIGFYPSKRTKTDDQDQETKRRAFDESVSNAGLGFQLSANIPDYLGKDRGIFIRYDIPLWLSSPENNESNFKYRNVVGIGAIFNF